MPLSWCSPVSVKLKPLPATNSLRSGHHRSRGTGDPYPASNSSRATRVYRGRIATGDGYDALRGLVQVDFDPLQARNDVLQLFRGVRVVAAVLLVARPRHEGSGDRRGDHRDESDAE